MRKIYNNPISENRYLLWKNFINNKFDINKTSINEKNNIIDIGFGIQDL